MKKLCFLFMFTCVCFQFTQAQQNSIEINGTILNAYSKEVQNAHIINQTTKVGTISNNNGTYKLVVKLGDWIRVSHVNYHSKQFRITKSMIKNKHALTYIKQVLNQLEEVKLKKKLKGILSLDRTDKIKDSLPRIDKDFYDFSKMDFTAVDKAIKKVNKMKELNSAIQNTDPTRKFAPITLISAGIPDKSSVRKKALRKSLNYKLNLPYLMIREFKEAFFVETLKIPKGKIFQFLDYCNQFGIEQLYKNKKTLQVLKILLKESKTYLQNIEKR
mgnify:FL=1